jgi:hypothetical protein
LPGPAKLPLEMESVNGLTPSWNHFGFLKMNRQKNLRIVSAGLLFPWYSTVASSCVFSISCLLDFCLCTVVLLTKHLLLQGSTKSGILGELSLNLTNYLSSVDPTAISLPLKKCNSGTVLQVGLDSFVFFSK